MTIYDPLGLIDHFLILLKILLQDEWRAGVQWNECIPENLFERWQSWLRLLPELEQLRIPRRYQQILALTKPGSVSLHAFMDASENAMTAVVFLRFVIGKNVDYSLVAAKTRVAPLRYTSIPRLELEAAIYGVRRRVGRNSPAAGPLSCEELRKAEGHHYREAQRDVYQDEVITLKKTGIVPKTSSIYKLSPFVDDVGVLRMRGRTGVCAYLHSDAKNPVILPSSHRVTELLLIYYHEKYMHRNYEIAVNEVRQKCSIFRLRQSPSRVRRNCQWRKNRDAVPITPEMADLPAARLSAYTRPFAHVGVDYFGPIEVLVGRRVEKRWGVLLTCLTTRAVHIEVANTLTTNSCIMALQNFITRRGTPVSFYSDRGTNFVGASRMLDQIQQTLDGQQLMREFITPTTAWRFNPPVSPHMGGSWERLVGSVKRNLTEVLHLRRPTDEELRNALTAIEGVLNARPLTHVPIEDEAAPALTPNHFLLGSSDGSKPLTTIEGDTAALRRGWPTSQWLANLFWKRWVKNYLPEITRRTKWYEKFGH
ncbi:uncharacterized protein LOC128740630 [Sabethes cyaneus]|uniref:uncharacterized protein LOC128740630 n=1 Tax=Sabethes cyaneus TaxID=53552 RepID=UPI00237E7BAB|nr:uncharacterized protein LOC128740630 [Sabethes cyaneus]